MQILKLLVVTVLLMVMGLSVKAQTETLDRQHWIKTNLVDKNDAVDFIRTAYEEFTPLVPKRSLETGIYKRTVKLTGCELVIETQRRQQESSWKSDREYGNDIVVIELDKVTLEGNNIKPNSAENASGLFAGPDFEYTKKVPSYSILTAIINKDDERFARLHYEQHLQWAYEFLIEKCSKQ